MRIASESPRACPKSGGISGLDLSSDVVWVGLISQRPVGDSGDWIIGGLTFFATSSTPLALPVVFSGAIMTWARALGEFGATIIFAGNFPGRTQTMPLAIYLGFEMDLGIALTLAVILLTVSFSVLGIVKGVLRERVGAVQHT